MSWTKENIFLICWKRQKNLDIGWLIFINTDSKIILNKEEKEKSQYLVGKLIYFILTKSDITYSVNVITQYAPIDIHFHATERIVSWKETPL